MKLAFIFDTYFLRYQNHFFGNSLGVSFWESRYLPVFDKMIVIAREKILTKNPSLEKVQSDSEKVFFACVPNRPPIKRLFHIKEENDFIEDHIRDCDFVICRSWWGTKACRKMHKPYMIEVINCAWDAFWNHSFLGKIFALPNYLMQRKAIRNASSVVYVTNSFLQKRYPTKGLNCGISDVVLTKDFIDCELNDRIKKINQCNDKLVLGTAAAVDVKYKGQEFVIKAIAMLKKMGVGNVEYQLVGGGSPRRLMSIAQKYGVSNNVKILGTVPHDKIFDWLKNIDVYVQPSKTEGLPRSVVEAMSCALPCLGSSAGGIPELLDESCICNLKGNLAKSFADKIKRLSKEWLMNQAQRNYLVAKSYEKKVIDEKRLSFLKKALNATMKEEISKI